MQSGSYLLDVRARSLVVSDVRIRVQVRPLAIIYYIGRSELYAVIAQLMSKCCEAGGKSNEELEVAYPFPCCPVIRECSVKESQVEKIKTFCKNIAYIAASIHHVKNNPIKNTSVH